MKHKLEKLHKINEAIDKFAQVCAFTSAINVLMVFIAIMVDHTLVGVCSKFMIVMMFMPIIPAGLLGIVSLFIDMRIKYLTKKIKA